MMNDATVSIIIPTQRRPASLARALGSALAQTGVEPGRLDLVVVDNDAAPSARELVAAAAAAAPFPVHYVHEPQSGVANARNAAAAACSGAFIAFLDDDEEAPPGWLAALLDVQSRFDADVVFGPVRGRAPATVVGHRDYLERFFSREDKAGAGLIDRYYGCGDSLIRRAALPDPRQPFSASRNQIGGEDDLLFGAMRQRGARFAWAPDAWVWEDPAPDRLSLRYALLRAFAYGQGASARCAAARPPDRLGVAGWMAIGLGQAIVYGAEAAFKWLTRAPDRAFAADRAARGVGKTLWWKPFKIKFYGLTVDSGENPR
jgi:succinoglycan biosynthesis protein ExoM